MFVARWMLDIVRTTLPSEAGNHLQFEADLPLLAFGFALSLLTALLFGMLPAIHSTRIRVTTMAKSQGGVTSTGASGPLRSALVTSQIALALALLVVAGLFAKSLVNISPHRPRHADLQSDDVQGVAGVERILRRALAQLCSSRSPMN